MPHLTDLRSASVTLQETCSLINWSCQLYTQPSRLCSPWQKHQSSPHVSLSRAQFLWLLMGKCRFWVVKGALSLLQKVRVTIYEKSLLTIVSSPPKVLISFWCLRVLSPFLKYFIISSIVLRKISTSQGNRLVFLNTFIPSGIWESNLYFMKITMKKRTLQIYNFQ